MNHLQFQAWDIRTFFFMPIIAATCLLVSCGGNGSSGSGSTPPPSSPPPYAPWASAMGTDAYGTWADLTVTGNGVSAVQRFRLVVPGTFTMGSPLGELGRIDTNESQHEVTLTTPYWIADSECTQRMWKAVMNSTPSFFYPPAIATENLELPVESVSYLSVQSFLTALNIAKTNLQARLPTESEWEYAARAGTPAPHSLSPVTIDSINCWVYVLDSYVATGTSRYQTVTVKTMPPNAWGLYEVHGNVWEWCADWWQDDWGTVSAIDPTGPASGTYRVIRGGSWLHSGQVCRSAWRGYTTPSNSGYVGGFRIAVSAKPSGGG